jgi:foldase protein PrsA
MGHNSSTKGSAQNVQGTASTKTVGQHGATSKLKVGHILVASFKQAEDIIKQLNAGGKFEDLAKKLSTDAASKQNGGLLGTIEKQDVSGEFWNTAISLRVNEVSDPVQDRKGFHIIKRQV